MSSLAKEPKTNQIFHRMFADKEAEECGGCGEGGRNPQRGREWEKIKAISSDICQGRRVTTLFKLPINQVKGTIGSDSVHTPKQHPTAKATTLVLPLKIAAAPQRPWKQQRECSDSCKEGA